MNSTLLNGYSGIKTHQFGVDSISNNIANVNTNGYRANIPQFSTIFATHLDYINASSPISNDFEHGATVASNAIDTRDGTYINAEGSPFNMAIGGKGWFVVGENPNGRFDLNDENINRDQKNFFTRDGGFSLDADAYLTNSTGQYLYGVDLGKIANDGTFKLSLDRDADTQALTSSVLEPIRIPQQINAVPTLTTKADIALNLSREKGLSGVEDLFLDDAGNFDVNKFLQNDFNTLYNSEDVGVEIYKDPIINVEVDGEKFSFTYGVDFKTIGEFLDAIEAQTGLKGEIKDDGTCSITFKNITKDGEEAKEREVRFSSNNNNRSITNLGISNAPVTLLPDNDASFLDTYSLKIPTYKTNLTVFDENGNDYLMQSVYRLKDYGDANNDSWDVITTIYNRDMEYKVSQNSAQGVLSFNSDGEPTYTGDKEVDFDGKVIEFNPEGTATNKSTNRLYTDSEIVNIDKDGNSPGQLQNIAIDENGIIYLQFSNNVVEPMGRVGLAGFVNDQGLRKTGSNMFEMIEHNIDGEGKIISGSPMIMWNEDSGKLKQSTIMQGKLETSNVDITSALTELIVMQRGYSANSKSFTTGDELLKEAINLKR